MTPLQNLKKLRNLVKLFYNANKPSDANKLEGHQGQQICKYLSSSWYKNLNKVHIYKLSLNRIRFKS